MTRNEVAKLVTSLKAEGLVRTQDRRICSIAGREVLSWTTNMSGTPTEGFLSLSRKKIIDLKERLALAEAEYASLKKQTQLEEE